MSRVALIVEGHGDVDSVPVLVARTSAVFGNLVHPLPHVVRVGCAGRLKKKGELERWVKMAASRPDADAVLIVLDLEDDCAAEWATEFQERADAISVPLGKTSSVCFCIREYEAWFLADFENLQHAAREFEWKADLTFPNPEGFRDAKGAVGRATRRGVYKETQHQVALTRKLNIRTLYSKSRSFRKFAKCVLGWEYDALSEALAKSA